MSCPVVVARLLQRACRRAGAPAECDGWPLQVAENTECDGWRLQVAEKAECDGWPLQVAEKAGRCCDGWME
eukprot:353951-Chlamydomonas_euryale.AAC.5